MKIIAITGSYRKGGVTDLAVDEILAAAEACGAQVSRVRLTETQIGFCTNCRNCTQHQGVNRGACSIADGMDRILDEIEKADGLVLASPVNFGAVTAVMKRFLERLVCYAYWPWGRRIPKVRNRRRDKHALLVLTSAAPAFLVRMQAGSTGMLKQAANLLGAKTAGILAIGCAATREKPVLSARTSARARALGAKLAMSAPAGPA
jgi:NAD(P)H-dependent FMN reductase